MKTESGAFSGLLFALSIALLLAQAPASAVEAPGPSANVAASSQDALRAHGLLERAVAHYKLARDKALVEFDRSGEFVDGELYVYVLSTDGVLLASGGPSSALIDRNVAEMTDATGKPFFREILGKAQSKGAGTVEYQWLNRVDNKVESKVAYFEKVDDRILAVGYYIARATPAQAQALLGRAVDALKADPAKALNAFNRTRGGFSEDDLYVFVVDLGDKRFRAHGTNRRLVGTDALQLRDPNGRPIIQQMIDALAKADPAELDYVWPNPVTGRNENKHTLLRKAGGMLVGVGYYTR
jgi:cytochrome c